MIRFYTLRTLKDWIGHVILIGLPVTLIYLMTYVNAYDTDYWTEAATIISLAFIIMFQVFGSAYTHETMHQDFFTVYKDRLLSAPVDKMKLILTIIGISTLISLAQTFLVLLFSIYVVGASFDSLWLIILLLIVNGFVSQLIAGLFIIGFKNTSKAQSAVTFYAIFGTFSAGILFGLPEGRFVDVMTRYSTPIAWAKTGIEGVLEGVNQDIVFAFVSLSLMALFAMSLIIVLSKRVIR